MFFLIYHKLKNTINVIELFQIVFLIMTPRPKVHDLDDIVPLPPAKLPKWDGKIAFQRWYEGEAPPKPSEALMQKLANQAGLRVDTGLDLETGLPREVKE